MIGGREWLDRVFLIVILFRGFVLNALQEIA
jgi:hypothetical protein